MKLLVQWTRAAPSDWETIDSADWAATPARADPSHGPPVVADGAAGWVHRLCVQGVEFTADHYAVEDLSLWGASQNGACRVTVWNDDPVDYPPGERYARVWTFERLAPDPALNGAVNTRQSHIIYAEAGVAARMAAMRAERARPWVDFALPPASTIRHGAEVPAGLNALHDAARSRHGWREWTEGLAPSELDERGHLAQQRARGRYEKPKGTRTYYHSSTNLATAIHAATHENELSLTTAAAVSEVSANIAGNASQLVWAATTPAGEPDSAAWPTGAYRHQIDCTSAGIDVTYGLLTVGTATGHFARVNTGLTADLETKVQAEAAFTGTGLKLATTGSVSWAAGAASDRWEILIAAGRPASMGVQTITVELNETDDFTDGPWPGPAQTVVLPFTRAQDARVIAPAVSPGAATVVPQLVRAQDARLFAPMASVGAVIVLPQFSAQAGRVFAPAASAGAVTAAPRFLPAQDAQLFAPTVIPEFIIVPAFLSAQLARFFDPSAAVGALTLFPSFLAAQNSRIVGPAVSAGVVFASPAFLRAQDARIVAPTITTGFVILLPTFSAQTGRIIAPSSATGAVSVALAILRAKDARIFAPTVLPGAVTAALEFARSSARLFAPSVAVGAAVVMPPLFVGSPRFPALSAAPGAVSVSLGTLRAHAGFAPAMVGSVVMLRFVGPGGRFVGMAVGVLLEASGFPEGLEPAGLVLATNYDPT